MPPLRILCAPDKFKGSLTAAQVASAMQRGLMHTALEQDLAIAIEYCPLADGGDGTMEALVAATQGTRHDCQVQNAVGETVPSAFGLWRDPQQRMVAVVETAMAAGLTMLQPDQRDPTRTNTYGLGMLIRAALEAGSERIIIGLGGSATNDGGCAMAQALGVRFFDRSGQVMEQPISGSMLRDIAGIDASGLMFDPSRIEIVAACDVTNPLAGPQGAAHVFAGQKGATPSQIEQLDAGLAHLATIVQRDLGKEILNLPGAGAAGGLGGAVVAFLGGQLLRGAPLIFDACGLEQKLASTDLVLTGEGALDTSSLDGKLVSELVTAARAHNLPTIAVVGQCQLTAPQWREAGLDHVIAIGDGHAHDHAIAHAAELIEQAMASLSPWLGSVPNQKKAGPFRNSDGGTDVSSVISPPG